MSTFQKLYFPLIISLTLGACSPAAVTHSVVPTTLDGQQFSPLGGREQRFLFRTGIDLGKRHFSGLVLLKALPDSSTRVVFLSELGLNLLDMSYRQGNFEVNSVQEFLDRKMILRTLQADFKALLLDLSELSEFKLERKMDGKVEAEVLRVKGNEGKSSYWYREESGTYRIRRREGLFRKTDLHIHRDPGLDISIRHSGIRLLIHMREIEAQE